MKKWTPILVMIRRIIELFVPYLYILKNINPRTMGGGRRFLNYYRYETNESTLQTSATCILLPFSSIVRRAGFEDARSSNGTCTLSDRHVKPRFVCQLWALSTLNLFYLCILYAVVDPPAHQQKYTHQ
jgi:hypothetical protein